MWQEFLSGFIEIFLKAVLPVLATALASLVAALITKGINWLKSKLDLQMQFILNEAVKSAVLAAEQVHLVDAAIIKKDYALDYATRWLAARGYKIDLGLIGDAIEAAVLEQFNKDRAAG
ncbi:MAG: hypothetical protein GYA45_11790 [Pelolinea sp.]|nr:hypothetical protein [Pelolinea sp.]